MGFEFPTLQYSITPFFKEVLWRQDIRADHIGSLLRPTELLHLRSNSKVDREQLRALEDEHIERVLQRQKDLWLQNIH